MATAKDGRAVRRAQKQKARRKEANTVYRAKVQQARNQNFKAMVDVRKTIEEMVMQNTDKVAEIASNPQEPVAQ
jgi:hypothetical protein